MTKQKAISRLPKDSEIPIELAALVGHITIRVGQLERILMSVYCRQQKPKEDLWDVMAELKDKFKTLGGRIKHIEQEYKNKQIGVPEWLDFGSLRKLAKERNAIHDALLANKAGQLYWLSGNKKRKHKLANLSDLEGLHNKIVFQINEGSLAAKGAGKTVP